MGVVRFAGLRLLASQPDVVLVDLVREGHDAAFEAIVRRHRARLLRLARRTGPAARAEDVVQQTFLQAYRALRRGTCDTELGPWLNRITLNASVDLARRSGPPGEELRESAVDGTNGPDVVVERSERLAHVLLAVRSLPERQRRAIVMRELEGRHYAEIAAAMGTSPAGARQLIHRARRSVRSCAAAVFPATLVVRLLEASAPRGEPFVSRASELASSAGVPIGGVKAGVAAALVGAAVIAAPGADLPSNGDRTPHPRGELPAKRTTPARPRAHDHPEAAVTAPTVGTRAAPRASAPASPQGSEVREQGAGEASRSKVGERTETGRHEGAGGEDWRSGNQDGQVERSGVQVEQVGPGGGARAARYSDSQ